MGKVKVSIITVTFNVVNTIEQTINSVLNQTYDNIEYIVVDGMSTDGTWEKICQYKDRISVLVHEKDKGLYDAMNKGIARATGDIIGIVNGDDWYEIDAVETVVNNFSDNIDVIYARMNTIGNNGNVSQVSGYDDINDIWYKMIHHSTVFVKTSVYDKYGTFNLDYPIVADYEMIFRFYLAGVRFKYIDKVITNFRRGGLTTKRQFACAKEVKKISMRYLDRCPEKDKYLHLIDDSYNRVKLVATYKQDNESFQRMLDLLFAPKVEGVCIFGAGTWGKRCAEKIKECGILCDYFIDNDLNKAGSIIDGVEVISSERLENMECNIIIALADGYVEICNQLNAMGNPKLHWIRMFDLYDESQEED